MLLKSIISYKENLFFLFLISLFVIGVFFQTINFDFLIWDDNYQITQNPYVTNLNQNTVSHNFVKERFTFIPLTVYSIFYSVFGENSIPFHVFNVILHLCNIILLFSLLNILINRKNIVYLTVILFALHPLRVESVAWISETKGLMMATFSLLAFWFYIKYLLNIKKSYFFFIVAFMTVAASLSKAPGLLIPISLFVFDYYFDRKPDVIMVIEKIFLIAIVFFTNIPSISVICFILLILIFIFKNNINSIKIPKTKFYILLSLCFFIVSFFLYLLFSKTDMALWRNIPESNISFSFFNRILMAGIAFWQYIRFFIIPYPLSAAYPYPTLTNSVLPNVYYWGLLVLLVILIFTIFLIYKRNQVPKLIFFGWFFFLINISIYLHIFPIEGRVIIADRYSYFPSIGLALIFAFVIDKYLLEKYGNKLGIIVFSLFFIILSFSSYQRAKVWVDTKTLFSDVINKKPNTAFAYNLLASDYMIKQQYDSAILLLNRAISIDANNVTSYYSRGLAFMTILKADSAINDFNSFLNLTSNPKHKALAYAQIGEIYRNVSNDSVAMNYLNLAIENDADLAIAYNRRGIVYLQRNKLSESANDFRKAVNLNPNNYEAWNNLGLVNSLKNEYNEAIFNFNNAILINNKYSEAYKNRGFAYLQISDINAALLDFNRAIESDSLNIDAFINRGRVYAMQKNFTSAILDFDRAIFIDDKNVAAFTNRAFAYFYAGDTLKSKNDFINISKLDENNPFTWQNLAWFYMQVKQFDNAIEAFEISLKIDNSLITSYIGLAQIYAQQKQFYKLDFCTQKILELNKNNANILFQLSEIYKSCNNIEKAQYYYKLATEIN